VGILIVGMTSKPANVHSTFEQMKDSTVKAGGAPPTIVAAAAVASPEDIAKAVTEALTKVNASRQQTEVIVQPPAPVPPPKVQL
jgi:hypothetical protein